MMPLGPGDHGDYSLCTSHLARCLVRTGGTEQIFAESNPKLLPALAFQDSFLTLTPENPTLAIGTGFGLSGCLHKQRRAGSGTLHDPRNLDFPEMLTGVISLD